MSGVSAASDIWSVGCTVIELLTCVPPYYDLQPMPALFRIVQVSLPVNALLDEYRLFIWTVFSLRLLCLPLKFFPDILSCHERLNAVRNVFRFCSIVCKWTNGHDFLIGAG